MWMPCGADSGPTNSAAVDGLGRMIGTVMEKIEVKQIIRSRRRTVALVVTRDATLVVRAPLRAPIRLIEDFVSRKSSWIRRKMAEAAARPGPSPKEYADGEEFLYLGDPYRLSVVDDPVAGLSFSQVFRLSRRCLPRARQAFAEWYKKEASVKIGERLGLYSAMSGIAYEEFKITGGRSRWGSCTAENRLLFNWRLVMAPICVIDYVVVHELAHVERKDHSRHFWDKVDALFPRYRESKEWLKDNGHLLAL